MMDRQKRRGRELKAKGSKGKAEKDEEGVGETMRSAVDNYSRKPGEGKRDRQTERQANYNYF